MTGWDCCDLSLTAPRDPSVMYLARCWSSGWTSSFSSSPPALAGNDRFRDGSFSFLVLVLGGFTSCELVVTAGAGGAAIGAPVLLVVSTIVCTARSDSVFRMDSTLNPLLRLTGVTKWIPWLLLSSEIVLLVTLDTPGGMTLDLRVELNSAMSAHDNISLSVVS